MGLGMVWYGAKYSHGVWERFAHRFENFKKYEKYQLYQSPFWGVYAPLPGRPIFSNLTFQCPFLGVVHFQKSDSSEPFFRCVVSPAGATHFQKSDFSEPFFRCSALPGLPIFKNLTFQKPCLQNCQSPPPTLNYQINSTRN